MEKNSKAYDLIIPVWTMGQISPEQEKAVTTAVAEGVGIAGCHGGMCDSFRNSVKWQCMTGGDWVAHPGNDGTEYTVEIVKGSRPDRTGPRRLRRQERAVLHARRSHGRRCWRRLVFPWLTVPMCPTAPSTCRWCGSSTGAKAASSIVPSAIKPTSSKCPRPWRSCAVALAGLPGSTVGVRGRRLKRRPWLIL